MKNNYYTFFSILLLVSQLTYSQQMPLDFSDSSDNFTAFSGSGFSFNIDPTNSGNDVGQFFNDGSQAWQGFALDLIRSVDLDFQNTISLSFYKFDSYTHNIVLKLENGVNADVEVVQNVPSGAGWTENIVFDFSNAVLSSDGTTPISATGTYDRITIFIDGGVTTPGTYLIDNIDDGSTGTDPNAIDIEYTDLVWSDEFDSTTPEAIDGSKWYHQTFGPNGGQWFNGEAQHYTNRLDNSFVENGFLNIVAKNENFTQDGVTLEYTSARLNSKFAFTYGRVDVRAKLPFGEGTWPAIWTLGKNINETGAYWQTQGLGTTNWPACGEIDIMEHGLGTVNHTSSALHTPSSSGNTINTASQVISDVANNFHIYSVNWSPDQITFLVDGVGFYTYNPAIKDANTWPFFEDQYILLNIAMGGVAGNINQNFTESSMVVDYVRVYQNTLSTEDFSSNDFLVYPNPANSKINIKSNKAIDFIEIYNVLGKRLLKTSGTNQLISIKDLKPGIYLLNVYSKGSKVVKKLIVN